MHFTLSDSRALLARTPAILDAWLRDLPDSWVRVNEGGDTWSAYDVLGHLIHAEETDWMPRARIIRSSATDKTFPPFDRTAMLGNPESPSVATLLSRFAELRAANLRELDGWMLSEADLAQTGTHPAFGAVTLAQLLATWTAHDLGHLAQVSRVMAKRYREDVGPWRAYLSVMEWKG